MRPRPRRQAIFLAMVLGLVLMAGFVQVAPRASAGAAIVFSEDFESGFLDSRWAVGDSNGLSGEDYWGVSSFRAHGGQYSAWAAQVGNQSSGPKVGQNNSDPGVQLYDDNMQADLVIDLRVNGFTSLTLSFFYFAKSESGGGDWIQAWYEAGGVQTVIFNPRGSTGNAWENVTLSVPNNLERLIIRFSSDGANHGFEGAYVDDIVLTGTEDIAPTSSVGGLAVYTDDVPYLIPFTADDNANASGVAYVEVWYRQGTTGAFSLYTRPANPLGQWVLSPIPFDASFAAGDGYYEFYTIAVDGAGNVEAIPSTPDASVTIDTTAPSLAVLSPTIGAEFAVGSVLVEWQGSDALSGIDHYEVSLDGGSFASLGLLTSRQIDGLAAGAHTVVIRAFDRAGNVREVSVDFAVVAPATGPPAGEFPWWIIALLISILVAGLVFFVWWRRRKDKQPKVASSTTPRKPDSMRSGKSPTGDEMPPDRPPI